MNQYEPLEKFATSFGYTPEEARSFREMAETFGPIRKQREEQEREQAFQDWKRKQDYVSGVSDDGDITPYNPDADPVLQRSLYLKSLEEEEKDPFMEVYENYGSKYLTGKSMDERRQQAAVIQKYGLKPYLENAPLTDLLTPNELEKREAATGILNDLSQLSSLLQGDNGVKNLQGIGPAGRFRPEFLTNREGITAKQLITNFTAQRMNEISGAAVSDKEVRRLSDALPTIGDSEKTIRDKVNNIENSILIGLELQEVAKREDITLDQAYKKYGADLFKMRGQVVPDWLKSSEDKKDTLPGNPPILGPESLMDQYWK